MLNISNLKKNKYTLLCKPIITLASLSASLATELTTPQQTSFQSITFPTFLYPSFMPPKTADTPNSLTKGPDYKKLTSLFLNQNKEDELFEEDELFIENEKETQDLLRNTQTQFLKDINFEKLTFFLKKITTGYDEEGINCTYSTWENYIFHSKQIKRNGLNLECLTNLNQIGLFSKIKGLTPLHKNTPMGYQIAYYYIYPNPECNQAPSIFWIESFNPKFSPDLPEAIGILLYQNQQEKIFENSLQEMPLTFEIPLSPPQKLTFSSASEDEILYVNKKPEAETDESPLILTIYLPQKKPQNPIVVDLSQNQSEYPTTIVVLSKKSA